MKLKLKRQINRGAAGNIMVYIVLAIVGAFLALPLVYVMASSIKPYEEIFVFPPKFYAVHPTFDNFRDLIFLCSNSLVPFSRYLFNSVFVSLVVTVGHIFLSSMAAYPLSKHEFVGKKTINALIVAALLFVPQVTFLPQYIIMAKLNLLDTMWALIIPSLGSSLGLFLMKQFMEQIPPSIIEAPKIDGASEFQIAFKIVFPNVKPAWLTLGIFTFQAVWNNNAQNIIFSEQKKVLPAMLAQIISENQIARMGVGMAATMFLMIPPIVFFIISQSNVVKTMAFAGIKE